MEEARRVNVRLERIEALQRGEAPVERSLPSCVGFSRMGKRGWGPWRVSRAPARQRMRAVRSRR